MMGFKSYRWAGAAVTAFGLFATTVTGQPPRPTPPVDPNPNPNPIDAAKIQKTLAEQKAETQAEADVRLAIENATQLAKREDLKPQAIQKLKAAKADIQLKVGLPDATRTRLTGLLDAKLAAIEGRAGGTGATGGAGTIPTSPGVKLDPKAADVKAAQERAAIAYATEAKEVRAALERIEGYDAKGQTALAATEIARLAKAYPTNPAVLPLSYTDTLKNRLADAQAYYVEANSRWVANQKNINQSALPAIYDVEFPKDWKEKSARRLKATQPELTAKEKKIIEALDKPTTVNFMDRPLDESLQDLSNMLDLPLLIDKKSLDDLGLDLKRGVTLQAKGLSARTVLRSVLATQGLTFVVKDETIQIVTVEKAKTMLVTRVYYLGDLVQGVGPFGDPRFGPVINAQQAQVNTNAIIDMIKKIDPLSWSGEAGGPGTITYHAPTQSIIVRNSAEVQYSLSNALSPKSNK
jgi:hypothetical protein